ncbi:Membrane protein involved in the export of O-antigen and teichoic acid [Mesobacillus persicus]|uniref:Membrane protein involved in the export of O-antigen and teichoic acid n=1 Tax=Mesobacillus persicus TaxID=930146 RepID=A0A1H8A7Z4_9BACI|nr:flippase [Mesobacillus persicus]SEM65667.1 Membrane protein involved in the export of O-antigen and teichoic acid [Mesobacillus persicus]
MSRKNSFLKDSFITLVRQGTSIVIGTLLIVIIARVLGGELQGQYALIITFPTLLVTFINFGLNTSTVYYVSKGEIDPREAFVNNFIIGIILGFVGVAAGASFIYLYGGLAFPNVPFKALYLILLVVPVMVLNSLFQTIFQGIQDFKIFNTILVITQVTNLLLVIVLIVLLDFELIGALMAFTFGHLATLIFILAFFINKYKIPLTSIRLNFSYIKKSFRYGFKSYLSNLVTFLNYRINIYILGFFVNPLAVGVYFTALNLGEKLSVFTQSISTVLLPRIASMATKEERNKLTSIVSRFTLIFMILFAVFVFLIIDFITPILGNDYIETPFLLKILLPGISLLAVEKILSNDIAARGKPEVNMYVSIFNVITSTALNIMLIPEFKAVGAAIATSISYSLSFLIKAFLFRKISGENFINFLLIKKEDFNLISSLLKRQNFVNKMKRQ